MKEYLSDIINGAVLSREQTHEIMIGITKERYNVQQIAALLMALQMRGVSVDELLGFRDGLLETGKHIDFGDENTIDIVGTGGDGKNTFNISTCSSFVVAGAGYKVTKHGNAGSTSVSGASNILQEFGAKFSDDNDTLRRSLDVAGICYLHAPLFAYGMKFVGPTRKALGIPTCFNLLGPLVNPCQPKNSLHGTATQEQLRLYANVHSRIGDNYGIITSFDGYDEISLTSGFKMVLNNQEKIYEPEDLGFKRVDSREISAGNTITEAKRVFASVLEGTSTEAQKNVIIANAACAIHVIDSDKSFPDSISAAREALESGKALNVFHKFLEINQ